MTSAVMPSAFRVGRRITLSKARKRDIGVPTRPAVPGMPRPISPNRHCEVASVPPASKVAG
ncbi:hypothetical protein D3C81_1926090 [compost metagenome]